MDRLMYRYVCVNTEACLYMRVGTCGYMLVCVYTHGCILVRGAHECMFACIYTRRYMHACKHIWVHASDAPICGYVFTHINVWMYAHRCMLMHAPTWGAFLCMCTRLRTC